MILSTTPQIERHTIREYKGIVTGETIIGANMFKDLNYQTMSAHPIEVKSGKDYTVHSA